MEFIQNYLKELNTRLSKSITRSPDYLGSVNYRRLRTQIDKTKTDLKLKTIEVIQAQDKFDKYLRILRKNKSLRDAKKQDETQPIIDVPREGRPIMTLEPEFKIPKNKLEIQYNEKQRELITLTKYLSEYLEKYKDDVGSSMHHDLQKQITEVQSDLKLIKKAMKMLKNKIKK